MRTVTVLGLATLALFLAIAVYLLPLEPTVVALQFTFSGPSFSGITANWHANGVSRFRSHFPADFALLALYGTFGALFARRWPKDRFDRSTVRFALRWSLPLAALADATENLLHLRLTSGEPVLWQILYPLAGISASIKWLCFAAFVVSIIVCRRGRAG